MTETIYETLEYNDCRMSTESASHVLNENHKSCVASSDGEFRRLVTDICDDRADREILLKGKLLKILIVEDDELSALVAIMVLKDVGEYHIDLAITGKEALGLIENNKYDIIFMDFGLPDVYGNEIAKSIRKDEKNRNRLTPIITLTAQSHIDIRNKSVASGMNDYIVKPITTEKAQGVLCKWVYSEKADCSKGKSGGSFDIPPTSGSI